MLHFVLVAVRSSVEPVECFKLCFFAIGCPISDASLVVYAALSAVVMIVLFAVELCNFSVTLSAEGFFDQIVILIFCYKTGFIEYLVLLVVFDLKFIMVRHSSLTFDQHRINFLC